jgi:hypothetical protein
LETLIQSGDRVALEGNNQKQADFLSRSLAKVDPGKIHDIHLLISSISQPEHLDLFENGVAYKLPRVDIPGSWIAPIMIYGDDVTHVVTEEGVACLYKAAGLEERRAALAAVGGVSPVGLKSDPQRVKKLRRDGLVAFPEDLQVSRDDANDLCWLHVVWKIWSPGLETFTNHLPDSGVGRMV